MAQKYTDIEIIEGLKQHDEKIFNYLFEELFPQLCYFAQTLTNDVEEAKDITIDIFVMFWSKGIQFNSYVNIRAFLFISTRNRCFNFLKSEKRKTSRNNEYVYQSQSDRQDDIEKVIIQAEVLKELHREIQKLPHKYRQVYELSLKGLKVPEIASMLDTPENTISQHKTRAVKLLKTAILKIRVLLFV